MPLELGGMSDYVMEELQSQSPSTPYLDRQPILRYEMLRKLDNNATTNLLAVGSNLKLPSSQTINLNPIAKVFQVALIKMVQELADSASGATSHEQSVQPKHDPKGQGDHSPSLLAKEAATSEHIHLPAPDTRRHTTKECSQGPAKNKRALSLFAHLRDKITEQIAIIRRFRSERFKRATKEPKMTAKGRGKLPVR
jgi:hypothetical protein